MTGQMPDQVRYRGRQHMITAVDGHGLFDPARFGLRPQPLSTACWRGFRCFYTVRHAQLALGALEIGPPADRRLFGVKPKAGEYGAREYRRLAAPIAFTGRLLLGSGRLHPGFPHMGFTPAWPYDRVHELTFTDGRMTAARNRSRELATVRSRRGPAGLRPAPGEPAKDWIDRTFSLTFDYAWPRPE